MEDNITKRRDQLKAYGLEALQQLKSRWTGEPCHTKRTRDLTRWLALKEMATGCLDQLMTRDKPWTLDQLREAQEKEREEADKKAKEEEEKLNREKGPLTGLSRPCKVCGYDPETGDHGPWHKCCPKTGEVANGVQAITTIFGWRKVPVKRGREVVSFKRVPQSYAKSIRGKSKPKD